MTLIACPKCGRKVLSVASVCPNCSFSLTEQRAIQSQRGNGTRCHRCRLTLPASTSVCPSCGETLRPSRRWLWFAPGVALVVVVTVALLVLPTVDGDQPQQPPASTPERQEAAQPGSVQPQPQTVASTEIPPTTPSDSALSVRSTTTQETNPTPPAAGRPTETRWTTTWVNIREGRGTGTDVVSVLDPGERVEVAVFWGGWWAVFVDGQRVGYIANSELQDRPPSE